jgi:hypothetical protein
MKKYTHSIYYLSIFILFVTGISLIAYLSPERDMQMLVLMGMAILYAVIGIAHHLIVHDLVFKIVVEYVLVAVLGIAIVYFIFRGGIGI